MTNTNNPNPANSFDVDAIIAETQAKADVLEGTEVADLPKKADGSVDLEACTIEEQAIYWKAKHTASTKGFHEFSAKTKEKINELQSRQDAPTKEAIEGAAANADTVEEFQKAIPNFNLLDDDTQASLVGIFNSLSAKLDAKMSKDPGIQFGRKIVAEQSWDEAFDTVASNPVFGTLLKESKADFKAKYFNPANVPTNIAEILTDLAKSYLFDKSSQIGAENALAEQNRIDIHQPHGGSKQPGSKMTADDWERLRIKQPQEFARRYKEFNEQMKSGALQE